MVDTLGRRSGRKFSQVRKLFQSMNMNNCGSCKVRKHKEIKGSDKIVTLNVSAKFDSLNKMKTTSSESKVKLERSGKGLVNALAFKTKVRSQTYKKARYAIRNVSMKELSNIIKEFEKIVKVPYVKSIPKHETTSSYYHLLVCITECMMRSDEHNRPVNVSYAEENAPSLLFR